MSDSERFQRIRETNHTTDHHYYSYDSDGELIMTDPYQNPVLEDPYFGRSGHAISRLYELHQLRQTTPHKDIDEKMKAYDEKFRLGLELKAVVENPILNAEIGVFMDYVVIPKKVAQGRLDQKAANRLLAISREVNDTQLTIEQRQRKDEELQRYLEERKVTENTPHPSPLP